MAESAPPITDVVYHATTPGRVTDIVRHGIYPHCTPESYNPLREKMYDRVRPDSIKECGVSRVDSVYAHPTLRRALALGNGAWLRRASVVVEIAVNPEEAYVCDGSLLDSCLDPIHYWHSLQTLSSYNRVARPSFMLPCQEGALCYYEWPEVLIPGFVNPDQIVTIHRLGQIAV